MPDMTATVPEPKTKGPSGPPSAPMLPVLGPAPDPTDDILDPPVPVKVEAHIRLNSLVEMLDSQAISLEDFDPGMVAALRERLRMPQDATEAPQDSPTAGRDAKTPWAEHEAQMHGFLEHLQAELRKSLIQEAKSLDAHQDKLLLFLKDWVETVVTANEHAQYQLSSTLEALAKHGLPLLSPPCQATVQAISPQGFPVTVTCAQLTTAGALTELSSVVGWLTSSGFTVPQEGLA